MLKDGTSIRGEVVDDRDPKLIKVTVVRDDDRVLVEIPRSEVRFVRRLDDAEEKLARDAQAALLRGDAAAAVALLEPFAQRRPKDARAHRELGFALLLAGRFKAALAPLQRACALDPIDLEAHLQLAQTLERFERIDETISTYRKATRLGPQHVAVWRALARALLARGRGHDRREALDAFRRASREDPAREDLALEWASALLDTPSEARRVLEAFAARNPRAPAVGRALAQLDAVAGRYTAAQSRLQVLLKDDSLAPATREHLEAEAALYAWLRAPEGAASPDGTDAGTLPLKDLVRAERRLAVQLAALPDHPKLQLAMARVLLRRGDHALCRTFLERAALRGSPEVAEDALVLQEVALVLGREAQAPESLLGERPSLPRARRLALLAPWLESAHRTLGRALSREGRFSEAAAALLLGSRAVEGKDARARLASEARKASELAEQKARNAGT